MGRKRGKINLLLLERFGESARQGSATGKAGVELLLATFEHMKNYYQLLIIPLTLWSGFEQAFLTAEFTAVGLLFFSITSFVLIFQNFPK